MLQFMETFLTKNSALLILISTAVTAVATAALFYATWVLARETKVLSKATAQPHVTAVIEPNQWALIYFDLVVRNSGNAPAYDIKVSFDPPISNRANFRQAMAVPLSSISVLTPGHEIRSALSDYESIKGAVFKITISWKRLPKSKRRETLVYDLAITDYDDVTQLGASSPLVQMAEQMKKMREDWQHVARGSRKISVNSFTSADREAERAAVDARYGRKMQQQTAEVVEPTELTTGEQAQKKAASHPGEPSAAKSTNS